MLVGEELRIEYTMIARAGRAYHARQTYREQVGNAEVPAVYCMSVLVHVHGLHMCREVVEVSCHLSTQIDVYVIPQSDSLGNIEMLVRREYHPSKIGNTIIKNRLMCIISEKY